MSEGAVGTGDLTGQAKQAAGVALASAQEGAAGVVDTVREQTSEMVGTAREHAQQVAGETRDQLRAHAAEQAGRLATTMQEIGSQLDRMISGQGAPEGMVRDLTQELASKANAAAARLQDGGFDGVVDDAKRLARNRPGLFLLGAAGAGVVAGRLLHHVDRHAITDAAKTAAPETGPEAPVLPAAGASIAGAGAAAPEIDDPRLPPVSAPSPRSMSGVSDG